MMHRNMSAPVSALPIVQPSPTPWSPDSWRQHPALQQPRYPDAKALADVQRRLQELPPLVTSWEVLALREQLADAQQGKARQVR